MRPNEVLAYCLSKPGAWQDEPWEGDTVAKVGPKIFAFLGSGGDAVGLKCGRSREEADEWLARYPDDASVMAYIGRSGWNTLRVGGDHAQHLAGGHAGQRLLGLHDGHRAAQAGRVEFLVEMHDVSWGAKAGANPGASGDV